METQATQKQRIANELSRIKEDVTPSDKKACIAAADVNLMDISRALNGNITNIDKAIKMLNVFRRCIAEREKQIAA